MARLNHEKRARIDRAKKPETVYAYLAAAPDSDRVKSARQKPTPAKKMSKRKRRKVVAKSVIRVSKPNKASGSKKAPLSFTCGFCGQKITGQSEFRAHVREIHRGKKITVEVLKKINS